MKEIKFRAWNGERMLPPASLEQLYLFKPPLDADFGLFEIMQYTGIKDRQGREIYEGDIVQGTTYKDPVAQKIATQCRGLVEIKPEFLWVRWKLPEGFRLYPYLSDNDTEIIGNKWENPELWEIK